MLEWPFCVGLIIKPASLAAKIRGSAVKNELIVAALAELKPLFLSQKEANRRLLENLPEDESESDVEESPVVSEMHTSEGKSGETGRLDKLEKSNENLLNMISALVTSVKSLKTESQSRVASEEMDDAMEDEVSESEELKKLSELEDISKTQLSCIWTDSKETVKEKYKATCVTGMPCIKPKLGMNVAVNMNDDLRKTILKSFMKKLSNSAIVKHSKGHHSDNSANSGANVVALDKNIAMTSEFVKILDNAAQSVIMMQIHSMPSLFSFACCEGVFCNILNESANEEDLLSEPEPFGCGSSESEYLPSGDSRDSLIVPDTPDNRILSDTEYDQVSLSLSVDHSVNLTPMETDEKTDNLSSGVTSSINETKTKEQLHRNLARHFERAHSTEMEVARILSMPKNSKRRREAFNALTRNGDFYHNCDVLLLQKGELILTRRASEQERKFLKYSDHGPCPECLGFMIKRHLWHHLKYSCTGMRDKNNLTSEKLSRIPAAESTSLLNGIYGHNLTEDFRSNILNKLRNDEISEICRKDDLISRFGAFLYEKYSSTQAELIRQSMRQLGRLTIELVKKKYRCAQAS
ncbi:unnamed protein product [Ceutorhynchus assimilis]|uniref:Uncharacterized protein n=1 Tax=Ceutorhynchus assimilis TaxID=467358 RepID=A0A9N9MX61_9CUCU|nr:unnamed protein product [Ceutorhynchus assimilis]